MSNMSNINLRQKGLASNKYKTWLIASLFVLFLMAVESYLVYTIYATKFPGTADFFSRWYGAKELILNGRNPYAEDVETETQVAMFGAEREVDQDQVNFAYPLYTIYLFWPLTFVPYAWAQAIWMVMARTKELPALEMPWSRDSSPLW